MRNYKRGDIYLISLINQIGCVQGGKRPCIIIQNNLANTFSQNLIVIPITSKIKRNDLPTHVMINNNQVALCEQIITVSKHQVICYQKTLNRSAMRDIDHAIAISLSLEENNEKNKTNL